MGGGGGISEQDGSAVLGGGGITEPERALPNSILLIVRLRGLVGKSPIRLVSPPPGVMCHRAAAGIVRVREATTCGEDMLGWTGEHVRHAAEMVRQGRNPAARVYESIGSEFFLAPSPGWLNWGCGTGPLRRARPRPHAAGWWRRWRPRFRLGA